MDGLTERQCHNGPQLFDVFNDGEGVCVHACACLCCV